MANTYDALTLEIERCETLAEHLEDRLHEIAPQVESDANECFALAIVALSLKERHLKIRELAKTLREESKTAGAGCR